MENDTAITVGHVEIRVSGNSITLKDRDSERSAVSLVVDELPNVISFLSSFREAREERRIGFRVPAAGTDLIVDLKYRGSDHAVIPIDVSLGGMLVESSPLSQAVEPNDDVEVRLVLHDREASISGEVRRVVGDRVAIEFSDVRTDGDLDPPPELVAIFRDLETDWLRERVRA